MLVPKAEIAMIIYKTCVYMYLQALKKVTNGFKLVASQNDTK